MSSTPEDTFRGSQEVALEVHPDRPRTRVGNGSSSASEACLHHNDVMRSVDWTATLLLAFWWKHASGNWGYNAATVGWIREGWKRSVYGVVAVMQWTGSP